MVVYKFVDSACGMWRSFASWLLPCEIRAQYTLDQVTYPPVIGSRLFAFDSQEHAEGWLINREGKALLECECGSAEVCHYKIPSAAMAGYCWEDGKLLLGRVDAPEGTVLVDWIKPLKVI